ncbi:MAG: hypothetical protein IMZ62_05735 [Chloroflexi bacterium]|nr:hypothetical protein [Chloroflexota bacterium]
MSDQPRPWPNVAKEARDRSAEEAQRIVHLLGPLVDDERAFTESDKLRREASALNAAQTILRLLEAQGAQTRPE